MKDGGTVEEGFDETTEDKESSQKSLVSWGRGRTEEE